MAHGAIQNNGSFRDPAGQVYQNSGRIFRTINPSAASRYEAMRDEGIIEQSIADGYLVETWELKKSKWPKGVGEASYVVEHKAIPYISYPYEWSFSQLKSAALFHLDFQITLLEKDYVLVDATAYNIQFVGSSPVFIDLLSIDKYQEGQFWYGHKQFCEQFLNPLLLRALKGIPHNSWYRGSLEGIEIEEFASLLSLKDKFSWNVFSQIVLQAKLNKSAVEKPDDAISKAKSVSKFSKSAYNGFLHQLRNWIAKLSPKGRSVTVWGDYAKNNTYANEEAELKAGIIKKFASKIKPDLLFDIGCNTGDYSIAALDHGAKYVVGFDFDHHAIELAMARSSKLDADYLPLWLDASNSSPNQGWRQSERLGFQERTKGDGMIALAVIHHLAIAKNIPLDQVVEWFVNIAPAGLIEFVPKNDETVQKMLSLRQDIFTQYTEENFINHLGQYGKVVACTQVTQSGRKIFEYKVS